MRLPGRIAAAIQVLDDVVSRHRPVSVAMQDWARNNRFAGSGDRAAIGNLVFDVLRRKSSLAHQMGDDAPRSLVLAILHSGWGVDLDDIAAHCVAQYGPGELSAAERATLEQQPENADAWTAGDYPEWLHPSLSEAFGDAVVDEGRAMALRAPVDVRVNTLKADAAKVEKALQKHGVRPGPLSPICLRLPAPGQDRRHPNIEADPAYAKGWFEIQDAGSQVASLLTGAHAGMQVADICAGAGGKSLAMAAMMQNKGQLHSYDADKHRLRPIFDRLKRAGARNVQVIPADEPTKLADLAGRMDLVVADVPCSGSGAWRRRPDAKWRFTPQLLEQRLIDQKRVLERAAGLVRPGGRLVYITCSVLPQENGHQIAQFLQQQREFRPVPYEDTWRETIGTSPPASADRSSGNLLLTPARHATDGFFIAVLQKH